MVRDKNEVSRFWRVTPRYCCAALRRIRWRWTIRFFTGQESGEVASLFFGDSGGGQPGQGLDGDAFISFGAERSTLITFGAEIATFTFHGAETTTFTENSSGFGF